MLAELQSVTKLRIRRILMDDEPMNSDTVENQHDKAGERLLNGDEVPESSAGRQRKR
jgi:hypothetical protein